jgi:hypothetical protein
MHQAKKGENWYFGMKAHVGVDSKSKIIHTVVATATHVSDVSPEGWEDSQKHAVTESFTKTISRRPVTHNSLDKPVLPTYLHGART